MRLRALIPQRISVKVVKNQDEKGVWASILELPHCYTQASDVSELPAMLTDLVLTHFEVPEEYRNQMGEYIPVSDDHLRIEEACRKLLEIGTKTNAGKEVEETFRRVELVAE